VFKIKRKKRELHSKVEFGIICGCTKDLSICRDDVGLSGLVYLSGRVKVARTWKQHKHLNRINTMVMFIKPVF
jgi:hypothetical protein